MGLVIILIHALFVCPLGDHRRRRDIGRCFHVIYIANESLGVETERLAHQPRDTVTLMLEGNLLLGEDEERGRTKKKMTKVDLPPDDHLIEHGAPKVSDGTAELR